MSKTVTCSGRLAENGKFVEVYVNDGRIAEIRQIAHEGTADDVRLYPGFIDMHTHGAAGVDVNAADVDGLVQVAAFLAGNGVTAWLPTLVPDTEESYRRIAAAIDGLMDVQAELPIAQALGVHYEGVFANEKMCGALRPQYLRSWAVRERTTASARSGGPHGSCGLPRLRNGVHMTTLAPEIEGGTDLIEELVAAGWVVAIGHTKADADTLDRAFAAGARHLTHFFNAMSGVHHRELGVAGWGLTKKGVTFDIIADGVHVEPRMLELACRIKSSEGVSIISDSVAPAGLGDGVYELWGGRISVENGRTKNDAGAIAGSVSTMLDGARLVRELGFSEADVARMTSNNPARLLGIDRHRGSIEVGKRADLVALDAQGDIAFTMIGGRIV